MGRGTGCKLVVGLTQGMVVNLSVYDIMGRFVACIHNGFVGKGEHQFT